MLEFCIVLIVAITLILWYKTLKRDWRKMVEWVRYSRYGSYVYFFRTRGGNPFRIGCGVADDLLDRLRVLDNANPKGIVILGAFQSREADYALSYIHTKFWKAVYQRNSFWINLELWLFVKLVSDTDLTEDMRRWLTSSKQRTTRRERNRREL